MRHTLANVCKNKYDCREIFSYKKRKKETEKWAPPVLFVCYEFLSSCFTLEWNFKGVCRTDIYLKCDIACTCWIFEKISSIFYFQDLLFLSIRIINVIEWKTVLSVTTCRIKKAKKNCEIMSFSKRTFQEFSSNHHNSIRLINPLCYNDHFSRKDYQDENYLFN